MSSISNPPSIYDSTYTPTYGIFYDQTIIYQDEEWESEIDLTYIEDEEEEDIAEEIMPMIEFPTSEVFEA